MTKFEIEDYPDLLNSHGKRYTAIIDGKSTEGIIYVEETRVFLLQNTNKGAGPANTKWKKTYGYKYSWKISSHGEVATNSVFDLIIEGFKTIKIKEAKKCPKKEILNNLKKEDILYIRSLQDSDYYIKVEEMYVGRFSFYGFKNGDWVESHKMSFEDSTMDFFKIVSKDSIHEETFKKLLLEKANKDYPIGTRYISSYDSEKHTIERELRVYLGIHNLITDGWGGTVFNEGKWSEIIKIPVEPPKPKERTEFYKGDYIVLLNGFGSAFLTNYIFVQRENCKWIRPKLDCKKDKFNGYTSVLFGKVGIWRFATLEEIEAYRRIGKPYDVTTLIKKKPDPNAFEAGEHVVLLSDSSGKDTWKHSGLPIDHVYKLSGNSSTYNFNVVKSKKGNGNGWRNIPHKGYTSHLKLRRATPEEIRLYEGNDGPVRVPTTEVYPEPSVATSLMDRMKGLADHHAKMTIINAFNSEAYNWITLPTKNQFRKRNISKKFKEREPIKFSDTKFKVKKSKRLTFK